MNLNTIAEVKRPTSADQITQWRDGYAWLAGGTWLFSEPQVSTDTLIDLERLNWPALESSPAGLDIAATCRVAELYRFAGPGEWRAALAPARVLQRVFGVIQDLECRHRRRQHLHVVAGRPDDLADRRTRRNLYAVAAQCAPARGPRPSTSLLETTPTFSSRENCSAASICPHRRCRSGSRSATPRSRISDGRRRC